MKKAPPHALLRRVAEYKARKREPQPLDGLRVNDQLCILQGSTGPAILRPKEAKNFSLIALEHSDYARLTFHLFDSLSADRDAECFGIWRGSFHTFVRGLD